MEILRAIKSMVFAETSDSGKVCQIKWLSNTEGVATLLVPIKAYDRFLKRAALRSVRIKVPGATKVIDTKQEKGMFNSSQESSSYYLIRATFSVES